MSDTWADDDAVLLSAPGRGLRVAEVHDGRALNRYRGARWPVTRPQRPYAVHLADAQGQFWTLGLDVDCDDRVRRDAQVQALGERLNSVGVRWAGAVSGPGGHRHLWATLAQPVPAVEMATVARALKKVAPDLDIGMLLNLRTGALRPPGSPHRAGGHSEVVGDPAAARGVWAARNTTESWGRLLAWACSVTVEPAVTAVDVAGELAALPTCGGVPHLPGTRRDLSPEMARLLREGPAGGVTADRSATAAALTASIVQSQVTFPDYLALVADRTQLGLEHLRTERTATTFLPRPNVREAAQRMWVSALKWVLAHPAVRRVDPGGHAQVVVVAAAVRAATWGGQGGATGRAVMDALLSVAARRSDLRVSASCRQLAEATGCSSSSCARAVTRLAGVGWLSVADRGSRICEARAYRLHVPDHQVDDRPALVPVLGGTPGLAPPITSLAARSHDALSHDGLGVLAGWVLDELTDDPAEDHTLAARLGLTVRTVRRHCSRLADAGLLRLDDAGRWHRTELLLAQVAADLSVTGVTVRRAAHHQHERDTYVWWLADRAAWPTPGRPRSTAPTMAFPRDTAGRRCWAVALRLVSDGLGLREEEKARIGADGGLMPAPPTGTVTGQGPVVRTQHRPGARAAGEGADRRQSECDLGGVCRGPGVHPLVRVRPARCPRCTDCCCGGWLPPRVGPAPCGLRVRRTSCCTG